MKNLCIAIIAFLVAIGGAINLTYQLTAVPALAATENSLHGDLLKDLPKTTTITDRNGEVLYYLYKDQNRIVVPADQFPKDLRDAVIAVEDERFYAHGGFDPLSFIRALISNSTKHETVSGGSTLTMQLVKNLTGDNRHLIVRKIKEAYLATTLESRYSKDQILGSYLNIVPMGGTLYGMESASRFYFNKPANQLSLNEAATLAGIINSPSRYSNDNNALNERRQYVIGRMVATGKIKEEEAKKISGEQVTLAKAAVPFKASHMVDQVIGELKEKFGNDLYKQGLTVTTTLDLPTQMKAEQTVKDNISVLEQTNATNVGMIVASPKSGDILAMVGSRNYFDKNRDGQVNLTTAPLSYGSTAKSLIYALLLEQEHWSPGAIMWDVKTDFPIKGERKPYQPKNYDLKFFGPMTIREALGNSRNVTAVKAIQMVGLEKTLQRFQDFGITSLGTNPSDYGPSLAIGGGGIPLTQMVGAYTALANGGKVNPTHTINRINNYRGDVLEEYSAPNKEVLKPEVAYEIADILQDNNARTREFGPNSQLVIKDRTVAAKTGTGQDFRTALTIGFTPDVVTGVIVANNDNTPLRSGAAGAMAAAPFFNRFMTQYLADKPNNWFVRPGGVKDIEFASVVGKVRDLAADWQSPTDRFNRNIAEIDDPSWNRAVAVATRPKEEPKPEASPTAEQSPTVLVNVEPPNPSAPPPATAE